MLQSFIYFSKETIKTEIWSDTSLYSQNMTERDVDVYVARPCLMKWSIFASVEGNSWGEELIVVPIQWVKKHESLSDSDKSRGWETDNIQSAGREPLIPQSDVWTGIIRFILALGKAQQIWVKGGKSHLKQFR